MKKTVPVESASAFIASGFIDDKIKQLGDWRGKTLAKVREIIHEADPEIVLQHPFEAPPQIPRSTIMTLVPCVPPPPR